MADKPAIAGGPPVRKQLLPFHRLSIGVRERRAVDQVLKSGWITSGPVVAAFERKAAKYLRVPCAVAVSSNTIGTTVALSALDIGPGDEVITSPLTFASTANVIVHQGARPRFADVDPVTLTLDPDTVSRAITKKTKAIIPVHLAGQPCDMPALLALARKRHLAVIEDAAHAFGASLDGKLIGSFGDATVFSFHAVKNLTTAEGGLITTKSKALAKRMRSLTFHGMDQDAYSRIRSHRWRYQVNQAGYKANFTDLQAALGMAQLEKFNRLQKRRREIVSKYTHAFKQLPGLMLPMERPNATHAWHVYLLRLRLSQLRISRDRFLEALLAEGITGNVHYIPVHLQPYYRKAFKFKKGLCPIAEQAASEVVTLPLFPSMTDKDIRDVVRAVTKLTAYYRK